jgi:branched-chain amino acid transport system ATP-binding protein
MSASRVTVKGPLIGADELDAGYGSTVVVRDLSLHVDEGEVVALLGPNGAGKTTTLRALCGELPALGGKVLMDGAPTSAPLFRRVRAGLGLVSEERSVLMGLTVLENLRVSRCDIDLALDLFPELEEHLRRRAGQLSGGQQQMVALARALARRPKALLADELSFGLAPRVIDHLLSAVRAAADRGLGVLLVEQHVHKVLAIADRAYVMRQGRVVLHGKRGRRRAHVITTARLARTRAVLVVIDVQESFRPVIARFDALARSIGLLVTGARTLGVPIIVTEQYSRGLGHTVAELAEHLDGVVRLQKTALAATAARGFDLAGRDQVLLCGIEAHICVHQTALALLARGVEVQVVEDAVSSRTRRNRHVGVARMAQSGVVRTSVEMALFELLGHAGTDEFKAIQALVR